MKKHKFKVGDVGYVICEKFYKPTIVEVVVKKILTINRTHVECLAEGRVCNDDRSALTTFLMSRVHPTPEACAQALVDEFYLNNPK